MCGQFISICVPVIHVFRNPMHPPADRGVMRLIARGLGEDIGPRHEPLGIQRLPKRLVFALGNIDIHFGINNSRRFLDPESGEAIFIR
jgi:hypothetical protein